MLSEVLMTAESTLCRISSKFTDVLLNSKGVFKTVQILQQQSLQSSRDLNNFMNDFVSDKNGVQARMKEIETVYEFVSKSLMIFQEHIANCQNLTVPDCLMLEIENVCSSEVKSKDFSPKHITYCNEEVQYSSSTNDKIINKENEVSNLQLTVKDFGDSLQNKEKKYTELQNKNHKLQSEIYCSAKQIKDLKVAVFEKDFCIQKNNSTIAQLKKVISEFDNEKKNLEEKVINLKNDLEEKINLSHNLEDKLNSAAAEKGDLQKQITDLLSFKHEKLKMLEDEEKNKTKCDQLISENLSLKSKIENITREKLNLENEVKSYCDKICSVEAELKKAVKIQENLSCERDGLKKKLHILKGDMQMKDKLHLEHSLLIEQLKQKIDKLRKEISDSGQINMKKINELSQENASLLAEINILKSQQKIDYKNSTNSAIDLPSLKSSDNIREFLKKLIDILAGAMKKIECSSDVEKTKTELLSQLINWEDNIKDFDSYISDMCKKLQLFLQHYISVQKDLESKLDSLAKAAIKYVTQLSNYCESEELTNNFNVTALGEISYLNDTLYTDSTISNVYTNCDINKLIYEMQKSCDMLDTHFSTIRTTLLKKEMEVKSLQDELSEMQQLKDKHPSDKQNSDIRVQDLETKCQMLLTNSRRLEKKHHSLLKTCEEMQNHIIKLQKEKEELENEAEEMATLIKNQTCTDENLEISMRLLESTKKLEHLKEENSSLKSALKRYESFNVSKIAEQSHSS